MTDSQEELREKVQKATGEAYLNGLDAADIEQVLNEALHRVEQLELTEDT